MRGALTACLIAIVGVFFTLADGFDDRGNPNDPATNERANACFEGGSMARKCIQEWEWTCGWYIIRIDDDLMTVDDLPPYCNILVDYAPVTSGFPGCMNVGSGFINFGNNFALSTPYVLFADDACTENPTTVLGSSALVYATTYEDADALCKFINPNYIIIGQFGNVWSCTTGNIGNETPTPLPEF